MQAQELWRTDLLALWYVGSFQARDQTRVPCIGRRILNHCAAREVLTIPFDVHNCMLYKVHLSTNLILLFYMGISPPICKQIIIFKEIDKPTGVAKYANCLTQIVYIK